MKKIFRYIYKYLLSGSHYFAGLSIIAIMLIVVYGVGARLFDIQPDWGVEVTEWLVVSATFLALAATLAQNKHVRMQAVTSHLPPGAVRVVELITLLAALVFLIIVIWYSSKVAADVLKFGRVAGTSTHLPLFPSFLLVPIGCFVCCIQICVNVANILKGKGRGSSDQDGEKRS